MVSMVSMVAMAAVVVVVCEGERGGVVRKSRVHELVRPLQTRIGGGG